MPICSMYSLQVDSTKLIFAILSEAEGCLIDSCFTLLSPSPCGVSLTGLHKCIEHA